jgi:hypothetical protein
MRIYLAPPTMDRKTHSYAMHHQLVTDNFARIHARQLRWMYRRLRRDMNPAIARSVIFELLSIGQWMDAKYLTPAPTSL